MPLVLVLGALAAACSDHFHEFDSREPNRILKGRHWYVNFSRAVSTAVQPDLEARAGQAVADGRGLLTFGPNLGSPLGSLARRYTVNFSRQINSRSDEPGLTLPGGEFFELVDLGRGDGRIGLSLFAKQGQGLDLDPFVDSRTTAGAYHAVFLRFDRPGIVTGTGSAALSRSGPATGTWRIDVRLSTATTLTRQGRLRLAPDGAVLASDSTTGRQYIGYGEPHGDWLVWLTLDTRPGRLFSMDILIRRGSGLGEASLNGRFNFAGFFQAPHREVVDTLFGTMTFDGRGTYFDLVGRNSFGAVASSGPRVFPYRVARDGTVTLPGAANPTAFVTRNARRRWLIAPFVNPSGNLGFYLAAKR